MAAWVKHTGRTPRDDFVLEAQYGVAAGDPTPPNHPAAFAGPPLLSALDATPFGSSAAASTAVATGGAADSDSGSGSDAVWHLVVCSVPTTAQREMAALEVMSRRSQLADLAAPGALLRRQGGVLHQVWPQQVCVTTCHLILVARKRTRSENACSCSMCVLWRKHLPAGTLAALHNATKAVKLPRSTYSQISQALQVGVKPYVDYIRAHYDPTQSAAIEVSASLSCHAGADGRTPGCPQRQPRTQPSLLPVVLIQGPPGTGKTHTVKVLSSLLSHCGVRTCCHDAIALSFVHTIIGLSAGASVPTTLPGHTYVFKPRLLEGPELSATSVDTLQAVLNTWHLAQYQRFN